MTMTQTEINFAKALYELEIPKKSLDNARSVLEENPMLTEALCDAVIPKAKKHKIIDEIFDGGVKNFLKLLCDRNLFSSIYGIFKAYDSYSNSQNRVAEAVLSYVTPPSEEQLEKIRGFLLKKYGAADVSLTMRKEPDLIGGFVLSVNGTEYDRSVKGRLNGLRAELIGR